MRSADLHRHALLEAVQRMRRGASAVAAYRARRDRPDCRSIRSIRPPRPAPRSPPGASRLSRARAVAVRTVCCYPDAGGPGRRPCREDRGQTWTEQADVRALRGFGCCSQRMACRNSVVAMRATPTRGPDRGDLRRRSLSTAGSGRPGRDMGLEAGLPEPGRASMKWIGPAYGRRRRSPRPVRTGLRPRWSSPSPSSPSTSRPWSSWTTNTASHGPR